MIKFKLGERSLSFNPMTKRLHCGEESFEPAIRKYSDIEELYDESADIPKNTGVYFMYRDLSFSPEEKAHFKKHNIRFDITVLIPQLFGNEPNKTYGHFHPKNASGKYFEEVYEVLFGNVKFLLQNDEAVYHTDARVGDAVLMKESFGHVSINPSSDEYLIMMDLVDASFSSIYDTYDKKKGASYFYKNGTWERNKNYTTHLPITEKTEKLNFSQNIYDEFLDSPEKFDFLK